MRVLDDDLGSFLAKVGRKGLVVLAADDDGVRWQRRGHVGKARLYGYLFVSQEAQDGQEDSDDDRLERLDDGWTLVPG